MPEGFAPGTPSWVDLSTPDVAGAKRFYGELFGWTTEDDALFLCGGRRVAGLTPLAFENQPTWWSTSFATDDVDALTARVREHGGVVHIEPMDVRDAGRLAFYVHPAAGAFGAWEARGFAGAELVNEPVSLAWNALMTRDVEAACAFLDAVFGLRADTQDFGGAPYTVLMLGDHPVGGVMAMPPGVPEEAPAWWNVSFAVADTDRTVSQAVQLGASVTLPPMDVVGVGRIAGLMDPDGAVFNVAVL